MRKLTWTTVACVSLFAGLPSTSLAQEADAEEQTAAAPQAPTTRPKKPANPIPDIIAAAVKGDRKMEDLFKRLRAGDPAVREEAATALAKVGEPVVPTLIQMLQNADLFPAGGQDERGFQWVALRTLERMAGDVKVKTVIPALVAELQKKETADDAWCNLLEALGRMGPEAVPVIAAQIERGIGLPEIAAKIGPAARPAVPGILEAFPKMTYLDRWEACQALACVNPELKDLPAILKLMQDDEYGMVTDIGLILDRMGPAAVPAIVDQLNNKSLNWYPRYGSTVALEMMGPKAKEALPALEAVFKDTKEDLDVRVGAARAIAQINGSDVWALYKQIPNLEQDIVRVTREKSAARRADFMKREAANNNLMPVETTYGRWQRMGQLAYRIASGVEADQANQDLLTAAGKIENGAFMDVNIVRAFMLGHSKSEYPQAGRLTTETESALKEYFFRRCDGQDQSYKQWKEQGQDSKQILARPAFELGLHANKPMNFTTRDYLSLGVLKDDPAYKDRKFVAGDTVTERYNAWNTYFKDFLKAWSLNGLWQELGSTSYEYHTYPSFINLADFAADPEVRKRARMYLDIALVEGQQFSIADLRGGSKSRAKKGGLGSNFNPYLHMIYGKRGRPLYHGSIAASSYQAPEAAILLHKLGAPTANYEIINRQAGEILQAHTTKASKMERVFRLDSRMVNYAYHTPEYVMGCTMFDPNVMYANGSAGRWSGVVFRDRAIISIPAYSGEKWNAQSKDVMVFQKMAGAYYTGFPRIDLTSGFDIVERDGWVFLSNGEAYAAINVVIGGYQWNDPVKGSLGLKDLRSPVILQTGQASEYKTFAAFQDAIVKAPLKLDFNDDKSLKQLTYTGPNSATIEFFNDTKPFIVPTIDGKPIDLVLQNNYSSPYMQSVKGSDLVTIQYGDRTWQYDFGKNAVVAAK